MYSWSQLGKDYFRQTHINVDGLRMREALTGENDVLVQFFDVEMFLIPHDQHLIK
ncbi:hypothetical protein [Peribacillus simplex]|uniref:hypothetical protein n=1 Tax=Peribacillus simplex TaxID=1478 RepID=UPI003D295945